MTILFDDQLKNGLPDLLAKRPATILANLDKRNIVLDASGINTETIFLDSESKTI